MKPIPILHLSNAFSDSSINRIILRLVQGMQDGAFTFHVAGVQDSPGLRMDYEQAGAETAVLGSAAELGRYARERQIRVVHAHSPRTILMAAGQPRLMATKHTLILPGDRQNGWLFALLDRVSLYPPRQLVVVSRSIEEQIARWPGCQSKLTLIHNAIPFSVFNTPAEREACRRELGILPEAFVIGFTGRLEPVKNLPLLLNAFARFASRHPEARLLVAGDGSSRASLQELAAGCGLSGRVIWTGFRSDIPRLLAAMDVYTLTSLNEGLPLGLLEAMAAGLPSVATRVGGVGEVLCSEGLGWLLPPNSIDALTGAWEEISARPDKGGSVGQAAQEFVRQEFGQEQMTGAYRALYLRMADSGRFRQGW